jgi:hypothetical protein
MKGEYNKIHVLINKWTIKIEMRMNK